MGKIKDAWKSLFQQNQDTQEKPQSGEVGFTGNKIFAGLPMDEYNPDLAFPVSTQVYDKMRKSDGQIAAVLAAVTLPIRSTKWYIQADKKAKGQDLATQIADFVSGNLFGGMKYSWDDHLREALLMLVHGFSVFETVWRFDNWQKRPVVMLDKYAPRVASSIWRFPQDENYNIVGVEQINYMTGQMVTIPLDKCRVYTYQREGDNIVGISMLRPAYKHWYIKDALYRIVSVGIEKTAVGTPFATLPRNTSDADRQKVLDALAAIRTAEDGGITVPEGIVLDILEGKRNPIDAMPFIEHQDTLIARSVLAQFLNLGTMSSASGGAYALGREMVDLFVMGLEAIANYIQFEVQKDVEKLVRWNFGPDAPMPTLQHKDITFRDMSQVAQALYWLGTGRLLQVDEDVENQIRDLFGLPPISKEALINQQGRIQPSAYQPQVIPNEKIDIPGLPGATQPGTQGAKAKPPGRAAPGGAGTAAAQNAAQTQPKPVKASEGAMHFEDGIISGTGGEKGEPSGTTKWRRDLTVWEKTINLEEINNTWDSAEQRLTQNMQDVMRQSAQGLINQILVIAADAGMTMNQKMAAINNLTPKFSSKYENMLRQQIQELFTFGQEQVIKELGISPLAIPSTIAEQVPLNAKAAALTDLQMQKVTSTIKIAAINAMGRGATAKDLAFTMKQASEAYITGPDLKGSATITVGDAINTGRSTAAKADGIQGAQWSAVLDDHTCPLCQDLDKKVISVDDPDFDIFRPPVHNHCRCLLIFIGPDETNVQFDWTTPAGSLVKKYGHLIV